MSMEALRWAWPIRLPVSGKVTLARLADMADGAGICFPSVHRLENDTGLSRRGVQMALADLERRGLIRRDDRHRSGSNIFRLTFAEPEGSAVSAQVRSECAGAQAVREGSAVSAHRTLIEPSEERTLLRSDAPAIADTSGQIAAAPFNARKLVWTEGIAILRRLTGKPEGAARSLMGKLLSAAKDDCAVVLTALRECPDTRAPTAWLMGAAKARSNPKRSMTEINREDWNLPTFADPSLLDDEPRGMLAA